MQSSAAAPACACRWRRLGARGQVVNNDPSAAVHYKLTVAPSFTDISLAPNEQELISSIWTQCVHDACRANVIVPCSAVSGVMTGEGHSSSFA